MARPCLLAFAPVLCLLAAGTAARAQIISDPCDAVTERYEALIAEQEKAEANVAHRIRISQMLPANKQRALAANLDYYSRAIARLRATYPADLARCRKRLLAMQPPRTRTEQDLGGPASSEWLPRVRREQEIDPAR